MKNNITKNLFISTMIILAVMLSIGLAACTSPDIAIEEIHEMASTGSEPTQEQSKGQPQTDVPTPGNTPEEEIEEPSAGDDFGETTMTMYIASDIAECTGEGPQTCMLVKENLDDEWSYFYSQIEGFEYQRGYEYELLVRKEEIKDPPAGASSIRWNLVDVVSMTKVESQENSAMLNETEWVLVSINNESPLDGSEITAAFTEGRISGSAGCNTYGVEYELNQNQLTFSLFMTTRMACTKDLMDQESDYLALLEKTATLELEDGGLILHTSEGDELIFASQ